MRTYIFQTPRAENRTKKGRFYGFNPFWAYFEGSKLPLKNPKNQRFAASKMALTPSSPRVFFDHSDPRDLKNDLGSPWRGRIEREWLISQKSQGVFQKYKKIVSLIRSVVIPCRSARRYPQIWSYIKSLEPPLGQDRTSGLADTGKRFGGSVFLAI